MASTTSGLACCGSLMATTLLSAWPSAAAVRGAVRTAARPADPPWDLSPSADTQPPGARPRGRARVATGCPVACPTEDSPSGLWRSLGKRVGLTPSGVQIPYPPPPDRPPV